MAYRKQSTFNRRKAKSTNKTHIPPSSSCVCYRHVVCLATCHTQVVKKAQFALELVKIAVHLSPSSCQSEELGKNSNAISNTLCKSIASLLYMQTKANAAHRPPLALPPSLLVENDKPGKAVVDK